MIGVSNHLLSIVFRFHYHSQNMIGSLGRYGRCFFFFDFLRSFIDRYRSVVLLLLFLVGGFKDCFTFSPYLERWSNLTCAYFSTGVVKKHGLHGWLENPQFWRCRNPIQHQDFPASHLSFRGAFQFWCSFFWQINTTRWTVWGFRTEKSC